MTWHIATLLIVSKVNSVPDMTYNVFGGTLSLTQSINLESQNILRDNRVYTIVRVNEIYTLCSLRSELKQQQ